MSGFYVTTAIPYVNAAPHLGHALELVQADVLARHRRLRGQHVRFLTGTDDNALKNVTAARSAGAPVREFVDANAAAFRGLREPLVLSYDDFIRTGSDRCSPACGHDLPTTPVGPGPASATLEHLNPATDGGRRVQECRGEGSRAPGARG